MKSSVIRERNSIPALSRSFWLSPRLSGSIFTARTPSPSCSPSSNASRAVAASVALAVPGATRVLNCFQSLPDCATPKEVVHDAIGHRSRWLPRFLFARGPGSRGPTTKRCDGGDESEGRTNGARFYSAERPANFGQAERLSRQEECDSCVLHSCLHTRLNQRVESLSV